MNLPSRPYYVIGAGGIGSWVIPQLAMLLTPSDVIHVVDKDILEEKNLARQLFRPEHIGMSKAKAICDIYGHVGPKMIPVEEWLTEGVDWVKENAIILVCVDNHEARRSALRKADELDCSVVNGANEYFTADAWYYRRSWADTPNDPRVFDSTILTDNSGSPVRPEGCTGHAQVSTPQLVVANTTAASMMMRLLWWWEVEVKSREMSSIPHWPVWHVATPQRLKTTLHGDRK